MLKSNSHNLKRCH